MKKGADIRPSIRRGVILPYVTDLEKVPWTLRCPPQSIKTSIPFAESSRHVLQGVERLAGVLYGKLFATPTLVLLPHQLHGGRA